MIFKQVGEYLHNKINHKNEVKFLIIIQIY